MDKDNSALFVDGMANDYYMSQGPSDIDFDYVESISTEHGMELSNSSHELCHVEGDEVGAQEKSGRYRRQWIH